MHHVKRDHTKSSFSLSLRELCVHFILGPVKAHGMVILMLASSLCHVQDSQKIISNHKISISKLII